MQKIYKYSFNSELEGHFVKELQEEAKKGWTIQTMCTIGDSIIVVYNVPKETIENTNPPY